MDADNNQPVESRCCDEYVEYKRRQWAFRQSRRGFLTTTVGAMAMGAMAPNLVLKTALADRLVSGPYNGPILVALQLQGGNDGLNTIVPFGSELYYRDRPTIGVPAKSVLPLDGTIGLHPNLKGLKSLYDKGKVAIIQGAGYANPDRSHFRSTTIWETADPVGLQSTGWLGRYLDEALADVDNPIKALALGPLVPQTLIGARTTVPAIESIQTFRFLLSPDNAKAILDAYQRMYGGGSNGMPAYMGLVRMAGANAQQGVKDLQSIALKYQPAVQYPNNALSRELQLVAQMIVSGLGTRIFHVSLNGFDDHVAEVNTHANLMKYVGDSLAAFYQDLEQHGKSEQVLTMTFSEFGRRVRENAGLGTDHGTAAPMFVMGGNVKGGIYGNDPILSNLDGNGDLKYGVDFRSVYGTILDSWLKADSKSILGGSFEHVGFL